MERQLPPNTGTDQGKELPAVTDTITLEPVQASDGLATQCNNCYRNLDRCIEASKITQRGCDFLTRTALNEIQNVIHEHRLRLSIWMFDCGIDDADFSKLESENQTLLNTLGSLFGKIDSACQSILEVLRRIDALNEETISDSGTSDIVNRISQQQKLLEGHCDKLSSILHDLATLQSAVRMALAVHDTGPEATLHRKIRTVHAGLPTEDDAARSVSDDRTSLRSTVNLCTICGSSFPAYALPLHEDTCTGQDRSVHVQVANEETQTPGSSAVSLTTSPVEPPMPPVNRNPDLRSQPGTDGNRSPPPEERDTYDDRNRLFRSTSEAETPASPHTMRRTDMGMDSGRFTSSRPTAEHMCSCLSVTPHSNNNHYMRHFTGCLEFWEREGFLSDQDYETRADIESFNKRTQLVRRVIQVSDPNRAVDYHLLVKNVVASHRAWLGPAEYRNNIELVQKWRERDGKPNGVAWWDMTAAEMMPFPEGYEVEKDVRVPIQGFQKHSEGFSTFDLHFKGIRGRAPNQWMTLSDLLDADGLQNSGEDGGDILRNT